MPQLDIFIFFSQYFIFLFTFLFFYIMIIKYIVKETDFVEQLGKYKTVSLYVNAALMKVIFDKLNKKSKNFNALCLQLKKNLSKNSVFELLIQHHFYRKYALILSLGIITKKTSLKFKNYIYK